MVFICHLAKNLVLPGLKVNASADSRIHQNCNDNRLCVQRNLQVPKPGRLHADLGFPIHEADVVHLFDRARQKYVIYEYDQKVWESNQLCSESKTLAAFCLSLPARNERGESRREGKLI